MPKKGNQVILSDTNAAYKIFFFMKKKVFESKNISIDGLGNLYFHPIVLEEAEAHKEAWRVREEYAYVIQEMPSFFKELTTDLINEIVTFIRQNTHPSFKSVWIDDQKFVRKRKAYEVERKRLQKQWSNSGVKGRKIKSKPSLSDYRLLYTADIEGCKLCTHDEILFAVAHEFLNEGETLKTEDIINQIYRKNPRLKDNIEEAINNLHFLSENINSNKIFRLD